MITSQQQQAIFDCCVNNVKHTWILKDRQVGISTCLFDLCNHYSHKQFLVCASHTAASLHVSNERWGTTCWSKLDNVHYLLKYKTFPINDLVGDDYDFIICDECNFNLITQIRFYFPRTSMMTTHTMSFAEVLVNDPMRFLDLNAKILVIK